jgi:DNA (cytosine-5)-methyltransferase 1
MRYLSVCSGIEAATVAWHPLAWEPIAFAEIDAFPSAVLAHHYPGVPNAGDFTEITDVGTVDLLVGGTPCQDFSVAGLRAGLAGDRGALTIEFVRLAQRLRPRWLVWENVPGVLSADEGRAFGTFLGLLGKCGYGFAYRVLDAQYFGVPQRRRRVFVVGYFGDWRRAAAVLFECEGLSGHPAPSREAGPGLARAVAPSLTGSYGKQPDSSDTNAGPMLVAFQCHGNNVGEAGTLRGGNGGLTGGVPFVFDETQITSELNRNSPKPGDPSHPLASGARPPTLAFTCKDYGGDAGELAPTLRSMEFDKSHANAGGQVAVAFSNTAGATALSASEDTFPPMTQRHGDPGMLAHGSSVRRLTPRECERLQGFPDDYTLVPYRGKPAADGPRYRALGNSMAVPVMRWIGERIREVA